MSALSAAITAPPPPPGSGPLRHGNPRGNPALAPRCGAKNRAGGCCQAPALRGRTRCKFHGGASTGPQTASGLARLAAARTTHGMFTAAVRAQFWDARVLATRTRVLCQALGCLPWLPPEMRAGLEAKDGPRMGLPAHPGWVVDRAKIEKSPWIYGRDARGRFAPRPAVVRGQTAERMAARGEAAALAPWRIAIAEARARRRAARMANHEQNPLDREAGGSDRDVVPGGGTGSAPAWPQGHGLALRAALVSGLPNARENPMDREHGRPVGGRATRAEGHRSTRRAMTKGAAGGRPAATYKQEPMDREHGGDPVRRIDHADRGPGGALVTLLWGTVTGPPLGLRARLNGGTSHDGSPFWISLEGGLGGVWTAVAAGEDLRAAIGARARYTRR